MKVIHLTHGVQFLLNLFAQAQEDVLLLKLPDGREFVLTSVERLQDSAEDLTTEVQQMTQNPELMALLQERKTDRSRLSLADAYDRLGLEQPES
ncbi:MAG: hypothetical protein BJG00_008450 [Limnothrix sp. CACIAM 69d]|nr:MAG: hypothetical protein BJG00_008450 [Limnothrix sp. CACIAM 69d]